MPGTSFDRVAAIYDRTRGGERRGAGFADALAPWVVGGQATELGIGTGVIASALQRRGVRVTGVDLSASMMRAAVERIGPAVAVADVERLPFADDSIDTAIFVWVLHLVDDVAETLAEAARVVRPGGRVLAILARADDHPDDEMGAVLAGLAPLHGPGRGLADVLAAARGSLAVEYEGFTPWTEFAVIPNREAELVEQRSYSSLFDVDDATWRDLVVPVIERLRAMPNPDDEYLRRNRHPLVVWSSPQS